MRVLVLLCSILLIFVTAIALYQQKLLHINKKLLNNYDIIRQRLYETSEKISKTNDENMIYSIALDTMVDLIPNATNGSILLYNNEDEKLYFKVTKGFNRELENLSIKKEEAYIFRINKFKETVIIHNPEEFDRINIAKETNEKLKKINALDISCTLSAPIYADDKFIGMINVDSNIPGHSFTKKDLSLMDQIKCELELAIKNALAQNMLKYLANYDELTGLINRRKLIIEYDKEIERIKHNKKPLSLVMIDLDDFKVINDTHGHFYGDLILKKFSEVLSSLVGKSNVVARFAGDEFVILFIDHDYKMAENKMRNIRNEIQSMNIDNITLSFCYGVYEVTPELDSFNIALEQADSRMYTNKKIKV